MRLEQMRVRQADQVDHARILLFILNDPMGWIDEPRYRRDVVSGSYRADWIWLAEDNTGRIVACAVWWSFCDAEHPLALDCLYVDSAVADRIGLAEALLREGHAAFLSRGSQDLPRYELFLKPGWRGDPAVLSEVEWRRAAAQSAGLIVEGE